MYTEIENYILENQEDSTVEIIQHFDKEFGNEPSIHRIVADAALKEYYSEWTKLTTAEKVLVASSQKQLL